MSINFLVVLDFMLAGSVGGGKQGKCYSCLSCPLTDIMLISHNICFMQALKEEVKVGRHFSTHKRYSNLLIVSSPQPVRSN